MSSKALGVPSAGSGARLVGVALAQVIFDRVPPATWELTLTVMSVSGVLTNVFVVEPVGQDAELETTADWASGAA